MVNIILESVLLHVVCFILAQYAGTACHVNVTKELNKQFCTPKEAGEHIYAEGRSYSIRPRLPSNFCDMKRAPFLRKNQVRLKQLDGDE